MSLISRKLNRLKGYDYSVNAWYFVTICAKERTDIFGHIENNRICVNNIGQIIHHVWNEIPNRFMDILLDEYIVMPDHIHGIIIIKPYVGAKLVSPVDNNETNRIDSNILGDLKIAPTSLSWIVKWFKSILTINIRKIDKSFEWQRSFYDRIIRNEKELYVIRKYIKYNTLK